ncbi:MAG: YihA family ribosome biogenesis GTP-binding protein [Alphaproteobacteria bacterium]|nr:MAG: YihA family ribosome biogenesis GTP-binding protein [Alphaproteobacteria bacterium]
MTDTGGAVDKELEPEALAFGRWLFAQGCDFLLGAVALDQVPDATGPEIAFAGRSNVGKSSLVNALTGRKTLARTSATPGRTRELNFFRLGAVDGPHLLMVDLPGYGYARASKSLARTWQSLMRGYLRGRANLRRVVLLIDARHGIKAADREMMEMLDAAAVSYQVVLTKADKLTRAEQAKNLERVRTEIAKHVAAHPVPVLTSSLKNIGIEELRARLAALATA